MLGSLFPFLQTVQKIGFEDVLFAIKHPANILLINTLPAHEQTVLIPSTVVSENEEAVINGLIKNYEVGLYTAIIYGKYAMDESAEKKYHQLKQLGFGKVFVYSGGLFEWILLQDIYGDSHFPVTNPPNKDLLKYAPKSVLNDRRFDMKILTMFGNR
jgi:hypothetical protein